MIINYISDDEYSISNGKSEIQFWQNEDDNSISIHDQVIDEFKLSEINDIVKLLEHYAIKQNITKINIVASPVRKVLEFWTSLGYNYSDYEDDKIFIDEILSCPDKNKLFDTYSGVILLEKTKTNLNNSSFINKVYNQDIIEFLKNIPSSSLDMVYGDPDYNVGINYAGSNYSRKWNDYIDWYIELTKESMRVLKPTGSLFMMNYPKQNAYLRVKYLDDAAYDVQDYVWIYNTNVGHSTKRFTTAHRSILHATKTKDNNFYKNNVAEPYKNPTDKRILQRIADGNIGRMPYSWFYFDLVKNVSKDKTFHACQIPLKLVEMLIKSCTLENDDIFILFGGSGSELVLCKQLKRNFISCELHKEYYDMIIDRLNNNGIIKEVFKLDFMQQKNGSDLNYQMKQLFG
jgi:site-specific DNA-methyltransferase (adenine-specific)